MQILPDLLLNSYASPPASLPLSPLQGLLVQQGGMRRSNLTIHHEAADAVGALKDGDRVPHLVQLVRSGLRAGTQGHQGRP